MSRRIEVVVTIAVAVTVAALVAGPAEARAAGGGPPLPALECGTLPAGDVRLTADLTCAVPFTVIDPYGFALPWDDRAWDKLITIDLGGHTLDISAISSPCLALYWTPERCGILGPYRIINGTVVGNLGSVAQLDRVVVHGVVYLGSSQGRFEIYRESKVRKSTIVDGFLRVGRMATIQGNVLVRSWIDQSLHQTAMADLRILDNVVLASPREGIAFAPCCVRNDIGGAVARNLVIGSRGPGILVWASPYLAATEVRDNIAWANDGNGIDIRLSDFGPGNPSTSGPLTVSGNLAIANAGHGVVADGSETERRALTDGGGNRALGNALEPGCIGLVCA